MIDAPTAQKFGLVNHVYPLAELEEKTFELADKIAEKAPVALQNCKEAVKFASRSNSTKACAAKLICLRFVFQPKTNKKAFRHFWKNGNLNSKANKNARKLDAPAHFR